MGYMGKSCVWIERVGLDLAKAWKYETRLSVILFITKLYKH